MRTIDEKVIWLCPDYESECLLEDYRLSNALQVDANFKLHSTIAYIESDDSFDSTLIKMLNSSLKEFFPLNFTLEKLDIVENKYFRSLAINIKLDTFKRNQLNKKLQDILPNSSIIFNDLHISLLYLDEYSIDYTEILAKPNFINFSYKFNDFVLVKPEYGDWKDLGSWKIIK